MKKTLGLVGSRGYTGQELIKLLAGHDGLDLRLSVSARDKKTESDVAAETLDAYVLALPNGASESYVAAITDARPDAVIVDLSADHRFVDDWVYGQPERRRAEIKGARLIANPGCYATAMQLALAPLVPLLEGPANVFGVSGYSGAGTAPSPKNDPEKLRDNLMPYSLIGHVHEREVERQLGHRLFFMPHVAPFFQGITATVSVAFSKPHGRDELMTLYRDTYGHEPLVRIQDEAPLVRDIMGKHHAEIGGVTVSKDEMHAVVIATIDNLLGGAATQALRSLNLALGFPENKGVPGV